MKTSPDRLDVSPRRSACRRLLKRLVVMVVALVLLVALGEGLAYGLLPDRSTRFLIETVSSGRPAWSGNPFFMYRFSPARIAKAPLPFTVLKDPPPGTFRVCLLGGSEAMGYPDPAFGLGRQLELMLQDRHPGRAVEVVPMTLDNANSHILREAARDLRMLRPDAVVVLCGNDEIAGPYGPASTLGRFHHSSRIARLMVLFSRTRLSQACIAAFSRLFPARTDLHVWKSQEPLMMKGRLSPHSDRLRTAYRSYRKNMEAICRLAADAAPVAVVCTVPVNLRDCAPFSTVYARDEEAAQDAREKMRSALLAEQRGETAVAARLYSEVIRLDPTHADALFRSARLTLAAGDASKAAELFSRARDADALRLRADSSMNHIVRECAEFTGIHLFDAEAVAAENGIPGSDMFLDHIHFSFDGNHRLAAALTHLLEDGTGLDDDPAVPIPDRDSIANDLLYSPWGCSSVLYDMLTHLVRPPFQNQLTQPAAVARLTAEKAVSDARAEALTPAATRAIFTRRLMARPGDAWLAVRVARQLLQSGDFDRAENAAMEALRLWPQSMDARTLLVCIRAMRGDPWDQAEEILKTRRQTDPIQTADAEEDLLIMRAEIEGKIAKAKDARRRAIDLGEELKEKQNTLLREWAEGLDSSTGTVFRADGPGVQVENLKVALAQVATAREAVATAKTDALAQTGRMEPLRKIREEAEATLEQAEKRLAKATSTREAAQKRTVATPDEAERLADLLREEEVAQSRHNAAALMARTAAEDVRVAEAKLAELEEACADRDRELADAIRQQGGASRELRMTYLRDREAGGPIWGPDVPSEWLRPVEEALAQSKEATQVADAAAAALQQAEQRQRRQARTIAEDLAEDQMRALLQLVKGDSPDCGYFDITAALDIGRQLTAVGRVLQALPWQRYALDRDPWNSEAVIDLANSLKKLGDGEQAIHLFQQAVERNPEQPLLWENLAYVYCLLGQWEAATECFNTAETIAPFRYERYLKWADALFRLRQYPRAKRQIDKYLAMTPGDPAGVILREQIQSNLPPEPAAAPAVSSGARDLPWN